jgi:hypothetical protein
MRRRQKRLSLWPTGARPAERPSVVRQLQKGLQCRFGEFPSAVREQSLPLDTHTLSLDDGLALNTRVLDGIGEIGPWIERSINGAFGRETPAIRIRNADLLPLAGLKSFNLPNEHPAPIRQRDLSLSAVCKSFSADGLQGAVRSLECFGNPAAKVLSGEKLLVENASIGNWISQIEAFPHTRMSMDVGRLPESERISFLREAAVLKRLPADKAELLAVFRHVPVELISQMRFMAEKKLILYTLSSTHGRTFIRVHDMAAIRNTADGEIHLIPHRTRFKSVSLKARMVSCGPSRERSS